MSDFKELTDIILKFRAERDWKKFHNPKDLALSLVLEAGEVMEHFQWKNKKEIKAYTESHKSDIGDELADVLFWTLILSHDLHINLRQAFMKKMEKNARNYPVEKAKGRHNKYTEL